MNVVYLAGLVFTATSAISVIEYLSRTQDEVTTALLYSAPFVVLSQVCLYYIFSNGPSVMGAWITFSIAMSVSRIVNSVFILKEPLSLPWLLMGVTLMLLSGLCIKQAHSN